MIVSLSFVNYAQAKSKNEPVEIAAVFDLAGTREATLDIIDGIKRSLQTAHYNSSKMLI